MGVDLQQPAHRVSARAAPKVDRPLKPISGRVGTSAGAMRFQGGTMTLAARGRRTAVPAPASRCRARPARPWPAGAGRARLSFTRRGVVDMGVAVLQAGRRPARRRDDPPAPRVACAGTTASDSGAALRDAASSSRSSAGPASAASSSRHHRSAVRPASRQRASLVDEGLPAAHSSALSAAPRWRPTAVGVAGREAADRRSGQAPARRHRPGCRATACPAARQPPCRARPAAPRDRPARSRARVPNGTSTARSAQHSVSITVL